MPCYNFIRNQLFRLDPETAHAVSLGAIKLSHDLRLTPKPPKGRPTTVMGLDFPNPVGLAAGLDKNGDYIDALGALGFGFIEVGTVTPNPQPGNPKPRMFRLPEAEALINRLGFNSKGVEYLFTRIKQTRYSGILGVNIGKNADTPLEHAIDDYRTCLQRVYPHSDYVCINISSPNTPGLRDLQYGDYLNTLLAGLNEERNRLAGEYHIRVPLAVKIAPDLTRSAIKRLAETVIANEIDGVVATNTTTSRVGVEGMKHADEEGGLSGRPITALSTQTIAQLKDNLQGQVPIIGVGGIMDVKDAKAKMNAGASLVQLYTGFVYRGPALIRNLINGITNHS